VRLVQLGMLILAVVVAAVCSVAALASTAKVDEGVLTYVADAGETNRAKAVGDAN
jgi:hypothetical protein